MTLFDGFVRGPRMSQTAGQALKMRCPHCNVVGVFTPEHDLVWKPGGSGNHLAAGPRFCTNPECNRLVFFVSRGTGVVFSAPSETLDFDASGVPSAVSGALVEAIKCHAADCYRASALMVRRTLEELCLDRNADGKDLKKKIEALGDKITIPKELIESLDQLRILGNDAAHIEARVYEQIGREEIEIAIELAKEILKATYQYAGLLAKLRGLGKAE